MVCYYTLENIQKTFLSIGLRNGSILFQFDLGSGQAFIKSKTKVRLGEWVNVEVGRHGAVGYIKVGSLYVAGKSAGRFTGLNLGSELYLGGYGNYSNLVDEIGYNSSFSGCVSRIVVNGKHLDFGKFMSVLFAELFFNCLKYMFMTVVVIGVCWVWILVNDKHFIGFQNGNSSFWTSFLSEIFL